MDIDLPRISEMLKMPLNSPELRGPGSKDVWKKTIRALTKPLFDAINSRLKSQLAEFELSPKPPWKEDASETRDMLDWASSAFADLKPQKGGSFSLTVQINPSSRERYLVWGISVYPTCVKSEFEKMMPPGDFYIKEPKGPISLTTGTLLYKCLAADGLEKANSDELVRSIVEDLVTLHRWVTKNHERLRQLVLGETVVTSEDEPNKQGGRRVIQEVIEALKRNKQIVLYGPPGTGKTYTARETSAKILGMVKEGGNLDQEPAPKLDKDARFKLVVFHPAFEYEQFIRGLRPIASGGGIEFETVEGHFVQMCWRALFLAYVQLKPSPTPEQPDAIERILEKTKELVNTNDVCILVIDELNRGNVPALLGELVYALEKDKRGTKVSLPYEMPTDPPDGTTPEFWELFRKDDPNGLYVPHNLFIIATMNTSDRSIGTIDAAIRRRFPFKYCGPDKGLVYDIKGLQGAFDSLNELFKEEGATEIRVGGVGHSYFMKEAEIADNLKYFVIPLLREYVELGIAGDKTEELKKKVNQLNPDKDMIEQFVTAFDVQPAAPQQTEQG